MDAATARALVGDGDGGTLDYTAGLTALRAHLAAQTRSPQETALIHCNLAVFYAKLELYKAGVKECDAAIAADGEQLRAYVLKAELLARLSKRKEWTRLMETAAGLSDGTLDVALWLQLREMRAAGFQAAADSLHGSVAVAPVSLVAPTAAPPVTVVSTPPPSNSTSAAAPIAARPAAPAAPSAAVDPPQRVGTRLTPSTVMLVQRAQQQVEEGIQQTNAGNYTAAITVFDGVLSSEDLPDPHAAELKLQAYLGRGTARAMSRQLREAEQDFTAAIRLAHSSDSLRPVLGEAWKRRGQTRSALGMELDAIADFSSALQMSADVELYIERGSTYQKICNPVAAAADFLEVVRQQPTDSASWRMLGMCHIAAGDCHEAVAAFRQCVALDPMCVEAWTYLGQTFKELALWQDAIKTFEHVLTVDPSCTSARRFFGILLHGLGRHRDAARELRKALEIKPDFLEARFMLAVCLHGLGHHHAAVAEYTSVVNAHTPPADKDTSLLQHLAYYQRECARFARAELDTPLTPMFLDLLLHETFKEAWCKKLPPSVLTGTGYTPPAPLPADDHGGVTDAAAACGSPPRTSPTLRNPAVKQLLNAARDVGPLLQYNCPGFLPNQRQQLMGGLAAIHAAQFVHEQLQRRREDATTATCSWRDVFERVVRWRQVSEPNDPVVWVDKLPRKEFEAGFGSHTPMLSGPTKVVRYYPNFPKAFATFKQLALSRGHVFNAANQTVPLSKPAMRSAVEAAKDCGELYAALNCGDCWLCTPCDRTYSEGADALDGTRLTIQALTGVHRTYELSIRTPCTPPRWAQFEAELQAVWERFVAAAVADDLPAVEREVLTLVFYWYNFMPLARGTAATGYVVLLALFLAVGRPVTAQIPQSVQVDWEAILNQSPAAFMASVGPWLLPSTRGAPSLDVTALPGVERTLPTMRTIIEVLNNDTWCI